MENARLSLADFKAKAEKVINDEVLEKVQGGTLGDCHVSAEEFYWYSAWLDILT